MAKTNTTNTNATANNNAQNNRKCSTEAHKKHGVSNAAKKAGSTVKHAIGYGIDLVNRSAGEVALDLASAGAGVAFGALCCKGAHDTVTVGAQMINNKINMSTGKGTISVKRKFGGWKEISTSEYMAAINRGKKFEEAIPNYWTNRHADEINTTADIIGGVAGVGGTAIGFTGTRRLGKKVVPNLSKEYLIERQLRQQMHSTDEPVDDSSKDETEDK